MALEPIETPTSDSVVFYTIGHSNHDLARFLGLLAGHRVQVLVDARSSPRVRYSTHFNAEPLRLAVEAAGIRYLYLGGELGGRPADPACYDEDGRARYDAVARTPGFVRALDEAIAIARVRRVALMCAEEDPTDCHRRLLIGRVARGLGHAVVHIRGDGTAQTEDELAESIRLADPRRNQLDLFAPKETEWKSTRSVLPKRRPGTSSSDSDEPEYDD